MAYETLDLALRRVQRVFEQEPHDVRTRDLQTNGLEVQRAFVDATNKSLGKSKGELSCCCVHRVLAPGARVTRRHPL